MVRNSISVMDKLSVAIAFRGVLVRDIFMSAVNMSFMPAVPNAWVIAIFLIRVRALLLIEVSFVAVMVIPSAEMLSLFRMSIDPLMIPV